MPKYKSWFTKWRDELTVVAVLLALLVSVALLARLAPAPATGPCRGTPDIFQ